MLYTVFCESDFSIILYKLFYDLSYSNDDFTIRLDLLQNAVLKSNTKHVNVITQLLVVRKTLRIFQTKN